MATYKVQEMRAKFQNGNSLLNKISITKHLDMMNHIPIIVFVYMRVSTMLFVLLLNEWIRLSDSATTSE